MIECAECKILKWASCLSLSVHLQHSPQQHYWDCPDSHWPVPAVGSGAGHSHSLQHGSDWSPPSLAGCWKDCWDWWAGCKLLAVFGRTLLEWLWSWKRNDKKRDNLIDNNRLWCNRLWLLPIIDYAVLKMNKHKSKEEWVNKGK